ncbi:MAG TPA: amidohydrolase family protein [Thermoanaerobaculia bacterium]|nr:amidohydrolase family protein [Thermoanaerobaculia bacterium]
MSLLFAAALVLSGGTVVGARSDFHNAVIVIRDGRIESVGTQKLMAIPKDARVIDVTGAYIVPGLNDVFAGLNSQSQANAYLYMGVTSIVGSDEPGGRRGALLRTAKPSPHIHPLALVAKPEDVDEAAHHGAEVLLLYYPLRADQTRLAVARARQLNLPTIGELGATPYAEAIEAGVDAFVHASRYALELAPAQIRDAVANDPFGPPRTTFYQYLAKLNPDDPAVERWGARLARGRTVLIPTLSLYYLELPNHENPWKEKIAAILDPKDVHLPADRQTGKAPKPPGVPDGLAENVIRIEERYRRAGAQYLAGSGTSAFGTLPGISLHNELRMLTDLGLTPRQALAAATRNVGDAFRWPTVGRIAAGYDADLVVVDADPTIDIRNLKKIRMVILNGEIVDRAALLKH